MCVCGGGGGGSVPAGPQRGVSKLQQHLEEPHWAGDLNRHEKCIERSQEKDINYSLFIINVFFFHLIMI